ncbi:MAG TPA: Zn-ribbon domain-containing OB-fold protein [Candidatus Kryptonia bacterium]|nr:Zn-ribbon domain-containing OB-fold protein [Candidatus Kryptonia bacterium]
MTNARRPLPQPDRETSFYWEAARNHELAILRCGQCGRFVHYPRSECPACAHAPLQPTVVSGKGTIHSFTVTHYVSAPGFEHDVPFVVALVELDEQPGLRLITNLRECTPAEARIGMPVEVVFEDVTDTVTLPQFRPRR